MTRPGSVPDYAARMLNAARDGAALAAVAHDGIRDQPVFALFARTLLQPLQAFLDRGERRARWFLREQHALEVDFSDCPDMFASLDPVGNHDSDKAKLVPDMTEFQTPTLGFAAFSGTGKTTLADPRHSYTARTCHPLGRGQARAP